MSNLIQRTCDKTVSKEELLEKLQGDPDIVLDDYYCHGTGSYCEDDELCVQLVAKADFPTRFGRFTLYGFFDNRENKEHTVIVQGDVHGTEACPVRVHSECHTGDVWGSLRCDCRDQLEAAIRYIAKEPFGAVLYMRQEGRGIGLLNKLKAYHLQDLGLDTIEANEFLGFPAEARDYGVAARILKILGIQSINLLTNNPDKIDKLRAEGVTIAKRIPIVIQANQYNEGYMTTKKEKMGHLY